MTYLDMVDPDHIGTVEGDGITTPYVVRVDVGNGNVLNDLEWVSSMLFYHTVGGPLTMLLAPLTIRRPLPLMTPAVPDPRIVL